MSDPTGVPSALGIEGVEWSTHGGETIVLQVTGRWRRRRPTWSGQPTLVVEAHGSRHRFPAMPEPPSLSGAAPGTWRMSFSVPASLAPDLGGKAWLQLGAVVVPLPVDVEPAPAAQPPTDPGLLVQRRLRSYELAVEAARRRAMEAEEDSVRLNARIDQLELELERLTDKLAGHERARRSAEQRAHSERVLREEIQEELAEQTRARADAAGALEELAETEARIAELEAEIVVLGRRADEAEQLAAAAQAARRRTERELAAPAGRAVEIKAGIQAEAALARRPVRLSTSAGELSPAATAEAGHADSGDTDADSGDTDRDSGDTRRLRQERELVQARRRDPGWRSTASEPPNPLRREAPDAVLPLPPDAPQLEAPDAALPVRPDPLPPSSPALAATLVELRGELGELRTISERETAAREQAQARATELELLLAEQVARCARAYDAIESLRGALEALRLAQPGASSLPTPQGAPSVSAPDSASSSTDADEILQPPAEPQALLAPKPPAAEIDPERLGAALARLREAAAEQAEAETTRSMPDRAGTGSQAAVLAGTEPATHPWLARAFRTLAARDGTAAGRLALALLPALPLTGSGPVSFDLVLADVGCLQVSVSHDRSPVERSDSPREPGQAQFRVEGDLASFARLLAAGRVRRRLGRGMARWHGERGAFNQLLRLVRLPVGLRALHRAGVRPEPVLSLWLAALMIEPGWTAGERFTVAHQEPGVEGAGSYLEVRAGEPPTVTQMAPLGPVATTIVCPGESLLLVLDSDETVAANLGGEARSLALLQGWVKRAQSG